MYHVNLFRSGADLAVLNYGRMEFPERLHFGPYLRGHESLYLVRRGSGKITVRTDGRTYRRPFFRGDFLLFPTACAVTMETPVPDIELSWVSFSGAKAKVYTAMSGLGPVSPVRTADETETILMDELDEIVSVTEADNVRILSLLYGLLASFMHKAGTGSDENASAKREYVRKAAAFIHDRYADDITVADISRHVALNRTYFSAVFREIVGIPPMRYLLKYRIDQSVRLMTEQNRSVTETAGLVGFSDPANFSVQFKKLTGLSPRAYRKTHLSQ